METCSDLDRRKALLIIINCSLAHYNQPLIKTPLLVNFNELYKHLEHCRAYKCKYNCCSFISPFIYHLNSCYDILCPFCCVVKNFERERLVTALKNNIVRNSNLGKDLKQIHQ